MSSLNTTFSQETSQLTESEWREKLTEKQYRILRLKGTEYAFSGEYNKHYKPGTYFCAGCNTPLFSSTTKFDSGTGWPSFDNHIDDNVGFLVDKSHGTTRTEIICNGCKGHLGHVFNDGPRKTTGKRYCVNSISLKFNNKIEPKRHYSQER